MGELAYIQNGNAEELVDAKAVANYLKLHVTLVRIMAKTRKIPALIIKNGQREFYRFRLSEVERALRKNGEDASETTPRVVPARPDRTGNTRKRA